MTRETKIGLLVGLAFIIVIGILLSEHLTTATETPQAALALAGGNVRQGVVAPGSRATQPQNIDAPVKPIAPVGPVPTRDDLSPFGPPAGNPMPTGTAEIAIDGPTQTNPQTPVYVSGNDRQVPQVGETPVKEAAKDKQTGPVVSRLPDLDAVARQHGEELVPVDNKANGNGTNTGPAPVNQTNARQYKAQAGDTLSRIASLLPGGNTKSNRDAIVKLNPTLQKDPNKIIAGRTYLLPLDGKLADRTATDKVTDVIPVSGPANNVATYVYVVKPGDTLGRIAQEQLGTVQAIATIKALNQDVLKGKDVVWENMKLKLPAKTSVASGN